MLSADQKLIEIAVQNGYPIPSDSRLHSLTIELMQNDHIDEAMQVNSIARSIASRSENESSTFSPSLLCTGIANKLGDYEQAKNCVLEAEPYLGDWSVIAATFKTQAALAFVNLGEVDKARAYIDSITSDEMAFVRERVRFGIQEVEALIAYSKGNYEDAFEKYKKYSGELETHYEELIAKATVDLHEESLQKTTALQELNESLKLQSIVQAENISRVRFFLVVVALAAILAFALIWLLIAQRSVRQNFIRKLETTNGLLLDAVKERDVLLQEIHHRVKNNLQLVISLLNLQGRRISAKGSEERAERVIREIQGRVHTMSLIHKELYKSHDYESLNVSALIKDLASYVVSLAGEETQLDMDMEDVILDANRAMPAGLITCEVITNCLEHGRAKDAESKIKIELKKRGESMSLKISDNGPGFSAELKLGETDSLGMLLIRDMSEQAGGTFSVYNCEVEGGVCFDFEIPMSDQSVTQYAS